LVLEALEEQVAADLQRVLRLLPRIEVRDLKHAIGAIPGSGLALQVEHVEDAVGAVDVDRRRSVVLSAARSPLEPHPPGYVEGLDARRAEGFKGGDAVPAETQLVDPRRGERVDVPGGEILRADAV